MSSSVAPTNCEFKIAEYRRQQVVEVVRYATGHLTDHFHFLCLLKGRLGLPTFSDLLSQLFICLFKLGRSARGPDLPAAPQTSRGLAGDPEPRTDAFERAARRGHCSLM